MEHWDFWLLAFIWGLTMWRFEKTSAILEAQLARIEAKIDGKPQ